MELFVLLVKEAKHRIIVGLLSKVKVHSLCLYLVVGSKLTCLLKKLIFKYVTVVQYSRIYFPKVCLVSLQSLESCAFLPLLVLLFFFPLGSYRESGLIVFFSFFLSPSSTVLDFSLFLIPYRNLKQFYSVLKCHL